MNRSTKGLLRAAAVTPAAVLFAMAGGAAHADGLDGPLASAMNGPLKSVTGQALPLQVADLAHPQAMLPASPTTPVTSADGLVTLTKGALSVSRAKSGVEQAMAQLGKGSMLGHMGAVRSIAFSGITARCVTSLDGTVQGVTSIDQGKLVGQALSKTSALPSLPVNPPANFRMPTGDPGLDLTLNKQVTDPFGGMTVSAISLDGSTGATRDLGVAHCSPLADHIAQRKADGPTDALTGQAKALLSKVTGTVQPILGGLTGTAGIPTLPGTSAVPSLPGTLPLTGALPLNGTLPATGTLPVNGALPINGGLPVNGLGTMPKLPVDPASLPGLSGVFGGLPGLPGTAPVTLPKFPVGAPLNG